MEFIVIAHLESGDVRTVFVVQYPEQETEQRAKAIACWAAYVDAAIRATLTVE